jgi:phosphate-selective porin OprO/OprP
MYRTTIALRAALLAGAALAAAPASAAGSQDAKIQQLQQQLAQLDAELQDLKNKNADQADTEAQIADLKRSTAAQYDDIQKQRANDAQLSLKNGRATFTSADGDFSVALRTLVQYDAAYYAPGRTPAGAGFGSGDNFRRARFGVDGTLFKDWSYEFIYDFGGSGTEAPGISTAYIQYDGLGPLHIRAGAYPTPESFEDSTSASDLLFLERAQPTDAARGIAGSDGRDGITAFAYDNDYYAALSYTGGKTGDAAVFNEQQAVVGRFAWRPFHTDDANFALGADSTYVTHLADTTTGPDPLHSFKLSERPELNVDSENTQLITTGSIAASKIWEWGAEAAGNWRNIYGQGGYFGYEITRQHSVLPNPSFNGWYAQASWILTGESKIYHAERGAYGNPAPADPFSLDHAGLGAWEVAARYSDLDLNYDAGLAGTAASTGAIRGGDQKIWTIGLNWYANTAIKFQLDYQHTDVTRLNAAGGDLGARLDAVSLRTQLSL